MTEFLIQLAFDHFHPSTFAQGASPLQTLWWILPVRVRDRCETITTGAVTWMSAKWGRITRPYSMSNYSSRRKAAAQSTS
jgi:hypothetical protein